MNQPRDFSQLAIDAGRVFTPTAPIDERSLFAGRKEQLRRVLDAVSQKGQHAVIFGERGVGKTSLANVLSEFLSAPTGSILSPRINCDSLDTFHSIWKKVFAEIQISQATKSAGFSTESKEKRFSPETLVGESVISPDGVRRVLTILSSMALPIVIVDEFDRVGEDVRRAFADTIKTLSDHSVNATVVLVGVADTVDQLIEEHQSVERALVQIRMPRMSTSEIDQIILTGLERLDLSIDQEAKERIGILSQGLPHYAHLLGLYTVRAALDAGQTAITVSHLDEAIKKAIEGSQHSIRSDWHRATMSPRKDNLFADVLLACAIAETDELGFFAAQDVRGPMRAITGKPYEIPSFAQHLNEFCEPKRGPVLQKTGTQRRYRFRFINPLMQPFVIMQGFANGKMTTALFDGLRSAQTRRFEF